MTEVEPTQVITTTEITWECPKCEITNAITVWDNPSTLNDQCNNCGTKVRMQWEAN